MNYNKQILKENNRLLTEEKELATAMNTFFINITERLDLKNDDDSSLNPISFENLSDILEKNKHHPSLHEISQTFMTNEIVTEDQVREEI